MESTPERAVIETGEGIGRHATAARPAAGPTEGPTAGPGERMLSVGDGLTEMVFRFGWWYAGCLLTLAAASAYIWGHRKPLWYDEMFSVIVALQPDWHRTFGALPPDGNPPLYALLTRMCIHVLGTGDFAVRLPSLVAFLLALTGVYVFVRRVCGPLFGLLGMVLVFSEPGWMYAFEARPYALLLAWMMLALVSWQTAASRSSDRAPALAGMALAIAGGVLSHNLGLVIVGLPLLVGEATRMARTRRVDWPVLATALAALPALAFTWPMIRRTNALLLEYQHNYLHPLTWAKFRQYGIDFPMQSLPAVVQLQLFFWMVVLILATWPEYKLWHWFGLRRRGEGNAVPDHLIAAAIACAMLLPVTWAIMMSATGYYLCRYGIGTIAGMAMLTCLTMYRTEARRSRVALVTGAVLIVNFMMAMMQERGIYPLRPRDQLVYGFKTDLPIVVNDTYRYLPMWWYAPAGVRPHLVYLKDEAHAIQKGYVIVEVAMDREKPYLPMQIEPYDQFLAAHDHFLLDFTGTVNLDMKDRLKAAGYEVKYVTNDEVDNTLFDVRRVSAGAEKPAGSSGPA